MTEAYIENWLVSQVKKLGGIADKFVSPGSPGVPDRVVILPGGRVIFVELKTETGKLEPIQEWQHEKYRKCGAEVRVVKGIRGAREFIDEISEVIWEEQKKNEM